MYRIDDATAANALPTPGTAGTEGFFTEGSPTAGQAATIVTADFLNMLQEELRAVVVAGGITPSKTVFNQLLMAIRSMVNTAGPVVGSARNLKMSIAGSSSGATITADEVIVETALGGAPIRLANFNKSVSLTVTGASGMDTGVAPTSGYVAIYAIYNPTSGASNTLAVDVTSGLAPNVYGGANMPAGFAASALLSVWPTDSNKLLVAGYQVDRTIYLTRVAAFTTAVQQSGLTSLYVGGNVPASAREIFGDVQITSTVSSALLSAISGSANGIGASYQSVTSSGSQSTFKISMPTARTVYYQATVGSGTMFFAIYVAGYTI